MRVFVVGTPRSGTSTFYQACRHITNYTTSHERKMPVGKRNATIMPERKSMECDDFRDNHIYVDHTIYPIMATLIEKYPDSMWVHLKRGKKDCVRSLANQLPKEMIQIEKLYFWLYTPEETAEAYWIHTNNNISRLLRGTNYLKIWMEHAEYQWILFWDLIKAEGDFGASSSVWDRKYNSGEKRGRNNYVLRSKHGESQKTDGTAENF